MALSLDYITRQTGSNLRRNPSLSIATILTVAVSLALLGTALSISKGVAGATNLFRGDIQLLVWMNKDATQEQLDSVENFLNSTQTVENVDYVGREATFEQFRDLFSDDPTVLGTVTAEQLPTRFEVTPKRPDLASVRALGDDASRLAGVDNVDFAEEFIRSVNSAVSSLSRVIVVGAAISGFASAMIMYNTIRTGLYARRKEIEVMRLVGATRWFIRIPFMLEGLIQGIFGAAMSGVALFLLNRAIKNMVSGSGNRIFKSFVLDFSQILSSVGLLFAVGAGLGAVAAGIAVTRYLDA